MSNDQDSVREVSLLSALKSTFRFCMDIFKKAATIHQACVYHLISSFGFTEILVCFFLVLPKFRVVRFVGGFMKVREGSLSTKERKGGGDVYG